MHGKKLLASSLVCVGVCLPAFAQQGTAPAEVQDKYLYLEAPASPEAMAWVKEENARTAKVLEADPHFAPFEADALKIAEDPRRLAMPREMNGEIYNLWRDAQHVHGILRKTTLADYLTVSPHWQTVIDYDALARQDNTSWVARGMICLEPEERMCMVPLSAGGEDAETLREFDLKTGQFVANGFVLPRSKQEIAWKDADTLYVARDWGPGSMTKSGYPFIVKEWKRGTPLDGAGEVYRGQESDIGASANVLLDAQGEPTDLVPPRSGFLFAGVRDPDSGWTQTSSVAGQEQGLRLARRPSAAGDQRRLDAGWTDPYLPPGIAAGDEAEGCARRPGAPEANGGVPAHGGGVSGRLGEDAGSSAADHARPRAGTCVRLHACRYGLDTQTVGNPGQRFSQHCGHQHCQ
jgi:hypothetical protein